MQSAVAVCRIMHSEVLVPGRAGEMSARGRVPVDGCVPLQLRADATGVAGREIDCGAV